MNMSTSIPEHGTHSSELTVLSSERLGLNTL